MHSSMREVPQPHRPPPGNAWSDPEIDNRAALAFWWSHAIVSTETRDGALKTCDFAAIGPLVSASVDRADSTAAVCCSFCPCHLRQCTDRARNRLARRHRLLVHPWVLGI